MDNDDDEYIIIIMVGCNKNSLIITTCADVPKRVNRASGVTIYRERERKRSRLAKVTLLSFFTFAGRIM